MNKKTLIRNLIVSLIFSAILGYAVYIFLQYQNYFDSLIRNIILGCIAALFVCVWWIFLVDLRESKKNGFSSEPKEDEEEEDDEEYGYGNPDMMAYMEQATMEISVNGAEDGPVVLQPSAEGASRFSSEPAEQSKPQKEESLRGEILFPSHSHRAQKEDSLEFIAQPEQPLMVSEPLVVPSPVPEPSEPLFAAQPELAAEADKEEEDASPVIEFAVEQPSEESVSQPETSNAQEPVQAPAQQEPAAQEEPAVQEEAVQSVPAAEEPAPAPQPSAAEVQMAATLAQAMEEAAKELPDPDPIVLELPQVPEKPDVNTVDLFSLTPEYISMLNDREKKILAMRIGKEQRRRADIRAQQEAIMRTQELQLYAQAQAQRRMAEEQQRLEQQRLNAMQMNDLTAAADSITSAVSSYSDYVDPATLSEEEREEMLRKEEEERLEVMRNREALIRQETARRSMVHASERQALRTAQQEAARMELARLAQQEAIQQEIDRQKAAEQALQDAARFAYLEAERLAKEQLVQKELARQAQDRINASAIDPSKGSVTDAVQFQMGLDRAHKAERQRLEREIALQRKQQEAARHLQEQQQRRREAEAMRQQARQKKMAEWANTTQQFAAITEENLAKAAAEKAANLASITAELSAVIDPHKDL